MTHLRFHQNTQLGVFETGCRPIRIVEMFLFDTCTHKCAYCHFAESGKVLDGSQIKPYRDPAFIDKIVNFFNRRTTAADKWLVTLTGGEPLLMPNLGRLVDGLGARGNKVAYYSALLIGEIGCPRAGEISCICDIHFQQGINEGANDRKNFEREKRSYAAPIALDELRHELDKRHIFFSAQPPDIGQTKTGGFLALEHRSNQGRFREALRLFQDRLCGEQPSRIQAPAVSVDRVESFRLDLRNRNVEPWIDPGLHAINELHLPERSRVHFMTAIVADE